MRVKKTIQINNFCNFSENEVCVNECYNFNADKKLTSSIGVKIAKFPTELTSKIETELNTQVDDLKRVDGVVYFKQEVPQLNESTNTLMVYGDNKKLYINHMFVGDNDLHWLFNLKFETPPISLTYKKDDADAMILASSDKMVVWRSGYSPYEISDAPIITSMCMNDGVLFCTIKKPAFKIWYATDLDAENVGKMSTVSNYISLEDDLGDAKKVITFDESVYVFRDYGITKISLIKNEITTSQIYQSNTKILSNTISVCGGQVLFMTQSGMFSFNGVKVVKTPIDLFDKFDFKKESMCASSFSDKYYLALNINFNDGKQVLCEQNGHVNNVLMVVDVYDYSYDLLRGFDCKSLLVMKTETFEKMLVVFGSEYNNQIGEIVNDSIYVDQVLPKFWLSHNVTQDNEVKLFTKLSLCCDSSVEIRLITDVGDYVFRTYTTGLNEFNFKIACKQLRIQISSLSKMVSVENVSVDYYDS